MGSSVKSAKTLKPRASRVVARPGLTIAASLPPVCSEATLAATAFVWEPKNKERVKKVLASYLRLGKIEQAEEHYQSALKVMTKKPYADIAGISSMIEFMAESDPLVAKIKPEEVINHSVLKKLDDSGFLDQLYKK